MTSIQSMTDAVAEIDRNQDAMAGAEIDKFAKQGSNFRKQAEKTATLLIDAGLPRNKFPDTFKQGHPLCECFKDLVIPTRPKAEQKRLKSTKPERKDWSEDAKKAYDQLVTVEIRRPYKALMAWLEHVEAQRNGAVAQGSSPRNKADKTEWSADQRTVGAMHYLRKQNSPDEPTQAQVDRAKFFTEVLHEYCERFGTHEVKQMDTAMTNGWCSAGITLKKTK